MAIPDDKERLAVIMPKDLKSKLQLLADEDKRSMSNYVLKLIEEHVRGKE